MHGVDEGRELTAGVIHLELLRWRPGRSLGSHQVDSEVREDLSNNFLLFYERYDPHLPVAFRADQGIDLPGSSPGQAPIF